MFVFFSDCLAPNEAALIASLLALKCVGLAYHAFAAVTVTGVLASGECGLLLLLLLLVVAKVVAVFVQC